MYFQLIILIFLILILFFLKRCCVREGFLIASCHHYPNDLTGLFSVNHMERGADPYFGTIEQSNERSQCNKSKSHSSPFTHNGKCCLPHDENTPLPEIMCENITNNYESDREYPDMYNYNADTEDNILDLGTEEIIVEEIREEI